MRVRLLPLCALLMLPIAATAAQTSAPQSPRLKSTGERALKAGKGDRAVGIVAVKDEEGGNRPGGWFGPQDVAVGEKGELLIADTNNRRVLVMDRAGKVTGRLPMPAGIESYFVSAADPGWVAIAGEAHEKLWVARLPARGRQMLPAVQLPADWSPSDLYDMAADKEGAIYLYMRFYLGEAWSPSVWRLGKGEHTPERVTIPGHAEWDWASLCRGDDGRVYALVSSGEAKVVIRFDKDGRVAQQWDATSLADWQRFVGDLVGVDRRGRVYLADQIVPDDIPAPAEQWGDHLSCCAPKGKALTVIDEAEIGYVRGDIESQPSGVNVGDREPVCVLADGSPVLHMASAKQFRLRFYPPPPWEE